jgi:hypothetical protein
MTHFLQRRESEGADGTTGVLMTDSAAGSVLTIFSDVDTDRDSVDLTTIEVVLFLFAVSKRRPFVVCTVIVLRMGDGNVTSDSTRVAFRSSINSAVS